MKDKKTYGKRLNELENRMDSHIRNHIKDDLVAPKFIGSTKPLFTYSEISERYDVSTNVVQKIADENGLNRRKTKLVK